MAKAEAAIWSALSDPTRRRILDALRDGAKTTGELADLFPTSRFAVMKHLAVLTGAGLVVVRRRGRERWNHLNAMPIQRIYERWVRRYESHWAAGLSGLERAIESGGRMEPSEITRIEMEIDIAAKPERVWKAITKETTLWWRKDFYAGSNTKAFRLEPVVGGRMYEDGGEGRGVLWYTVIAIDPPRSIDLSGVLAAAFGGPALSVVRLQLTENDGRTILALSDSILGAKSDPKEKLAGWRLLFEEGLKPFVEKRRK
jgi:DNA-binding transcriptional ArsR family regulator/uncharacterized protein YndB with AHSA1/START domain